MVGVIRTFVLDRSIPPVINGNINPGVSETVVVTSVPTFGTGG